MIALFGGTFDPVHVGHLRVAWEVAEYLQCPVRMLPCHVPSHRPAPLFDARTRVEMLRAALRGQTRLTVDTSELSRSGPSYTIDTLVALRAEVGAYEPLVWVIGADAFANGAPCRAIVFRFPDAATGNGEQHSPAIPRIDQHRVNARPLRTAAHPERTAGMIPQALHQLPRCAAISRTEESARNRAAPQLTVLCTSFERPDFF